MSPDQERRAAVADPYSRLNDKVLEPGRRLRETPEEVGIPQRPAPGRRVEEPVVAQVREVEEDLQARREKARAAENAIVEERLAHPLAEKNAVPEELGWDEGMRWVEHLALSGRGADASRLLSQLRRVEPVRDQESPGRLELIGDYLAESHPELARWFYRKLVDWLSRLPVDCAAQAGMVNQVVGEARDKLAAVEARVRSR
jgi:hypothetical protein